MVDRHGSQELIDDPFLHKLLERLTPVRQGRQIIHREARDHREQQPAAPEPLVQQVLRIGFVVRRDDGQHRSANLRMARFVALNAGHHRFKQPVPHVVRHRRQGDELQVGESGFKDKVGADGEFDRVRAQQHLVHHVPRRQGDPVVGVIEAVGPIELLVPAHQIMHQSQGNLGVAQLVQGPQRGGVSPGAVSAEARGPQVADDGGEFGQGQGGGMQLQRVDPRAGQFLEIIDATQNLSHRLQ